MSVHIIVILEKCIYMLHILFQIHLVLKKNCLWYAGKQKNLNVKLVLT